MNCIISYFLTVCIKFYLETFTLKHMQENSLYYMTDWLTTKNFTVSSATKGYFIAKKVLLFVKLNCRKINKETTSSINNKIQKFSKNADCFSRHHHHQVQTIQLIHGGIVGLVPRVQYDNYNPTNILRWYNWLSAESKIAPLCKQPECVDFNLC